LLTDVPWQARSGGAFEQLQPAWENYTGQTWEAHAGHGWFEAIHADDRDATRAAWAAACFERMGRRLHGHRLATRDPLTTDCERCLTSLVQASDI